MLNRFSKLGLNDIVSGAAFEEWIKANMSAYVNKEIPSEHLLIYLDYIESKVRENNKLDRNLWLSAIKELIEKIRAFNDVKV